MGNARLYEIMKEKEAIYAKYPDYRTAPVRDALSPSADLSYLSSFYNEDLSRFQDHSKEDFTDEDGIKASELEGEFATMNGWEAESDAASLLNGLGIETDLHYKMM